MHPYERYISARRRREAELCQGVIIAALPDGDYRVRLQHTRYIVRASRGLVSTRFTAGQVVQLSRTDASGITKNTAYTIIGFPGSVTKGASRTTPAVEFTERAGAAVLKVSPPRMTLHQGETAEVIVHGVGLVAPATYGSEFLSDSEPQVIAPGQIVAHVQAAGDATPGGYDLRVGGAVLRGYFRVVSSVFPAHSLWALTYRTDDYTPRLLRINALTGELHQEYAFDAGESNITDLVAIDGVIYAKGSETFLKVSDPNGAGVQQASVTGLYDTWQNVNLGVAGQVIYYGDLFDAVLNSLDTATDTESTWFLSTFDYASAAVPDGATAWLALPGDNALVEWDIGTATETTRVTIAGPALIANDGAHLYVSSGASILKIAKAGLGTVDSVAVASNISGLNRMMFSGGLLYATCGDFAAGAIYEIDPATMTVLRSLAISEGPLGFDIADGKIFVGDTECGIKVIDLSDFSLITRYTYTDSDPLSTFAKEIQRVLYT